MKRIVGCFVCFLGLMVSLQVEAMVVLNEVLADPPTGIEGDANGDSLGSSSQDEFIELLNFGDIAVDLLGWSIADDIRTRHVFTDAFLLESKSFAVVFGGGNSSLFPINWFKASTGTLSLNNSGDSVYLYDASGLLVDQLTYGSEGGQNQSLTRFPDGDGEFAGHAKWNRAYSPGYKYDGTEFERDPMPLSTVPEPSTLVLTSLGVIFTLGFKLRNSLAIF